MNSQRFYAGFCTTLILGIPMLLTACASKSPAPVERGGQTVTAPTTSSPREVRDLYTVRKGDTLYSIALEHGVDYRELAALNNIENPGRILVGQQLRVRKSGESASPEIAVAKPIALAPMVERRALDSNSETLKREPRAGKEPYSEQALAQAQTQAAQKPVSAPTAPVVAPAPVVAATSDARAADKPEAKVEAKAPETAAGSDEIAWIWPANGKLVAQFSEGGSKGLGISGKAGDPVLAAGDGKVVYSGTGLRGYGKLVIVKHNNTYLSAYAHNQNILVKEGQTVSKGQKIAEMGNTDADQVKLHFEIRRQGKPVDPLKHLPER